MYIQRNIIKKMATTIASTAVEDIPSTESESFLHKNRKTIIVVVLVIIIILVAWYYYGSEAKDRFTESNVSKEIDKLIKTINEKQKPYFTN